MFSKLTLVTCSMLLLTNSLVSGQQQPLVEKYLLSGNFSQGEQDLKAHLETNPKDDQQHWWDQKIKGPGDQGTRGLGDWRALSRKKQLNASNKRSKNTYC